MDDVRLRRLGRSSWALLGTIALVVVAAAAIGAIRGIVVPLVIAVIVGVVLEPLVEWLERRGLTPTLATVVSLLVAVAVGAVVTTGTLLPDPLPPSPHADTSGSASQLSLTHLVMPAPSLMGR